MEGIVRIPVSVEAFNEHMLKVLLATFGSLEEGVTDDVVRQLYRREYGLKADAFVSVDQVMQMGRALCEFQLLEMVLSDVESDDNGEVAK
jgi:hypothetical protein